MAPVAWADWLTKQGHPVPAVPAKLYIETADKPVALHAGPTTLQVLEDTGGGGEIYINPGTPLTHQCLSISVPPPVSPQHTASFEIDVAYDC